MMKNIKIILVLALITILPSGINAQGVTFRFSPDFTYPKGLVAGGKNMMEENTSRLLTEINQAARTGRTLRLETVNMHQGAKERLRALWENCPFSCDEELPVKKCLEDVERLQVRGIRVTMKPADDTYRGDKGREITVSYDKRSGQIVGVSLALNETNKESIMGRGGAVNDLTQRRTILGFVEQFRNYYNEKNLSAIKDVYSDDALIITGSVITTRKGGDIRSDKVEVRYNQQNKNQYMVSLKRCFDNNKFINVEFDKIEVARHPTKAGFYGVTIHQKWDSSRYKDDGWLFLLWDFRNESHPVVHVRTWQPGQVKEDDVFTTADFRLE